MDLNKLLRERQEAFKRGSRVTRRSDECLSFADLESLAKEPERIDPSSAAHLEECVRCRTLRDRFVAVLASEAPDAPFDDFARDAKGWSGPDGPRRFWKIAAVVSPLAAAACLVLAIGIWSWRPPPGEGPWPDFAHRVQDAATQADESFFGLSETDERRFGHSEKDLEELERINEQRRLAIEELLQTLGDLAEEARHALQVSDPAKPNAKP